MENRSAKNTPLNMDKWREIIDHWSKSGENQKSYCKRLGLNLNTFSYVRGKLQQKTRPKIQFAPLTIKNIEDNASNQSSIIFENSRGYKLHIPISLSLEQLNKLFKLSGWSDA